MDQENFMASFQIGYINAKSNLIKKNIEIFEEEFKGDKERYENFSVDIKKLS